MSFWDDISSGAKNLGSEIASNVGQSVGASIYDYFRSSTSKEPLVIAGPQPGGNLTAEQIAAGARGAAPPVAAPLNQPAFDIKKYWPVFAIAGAGALAIALIPRRGR